jgi:hypothetical protein
MNELHRICQQQGMIYIEVPHHSSWLANTPEHKLRFNYFAFDGFINSEKNLWLHSKKFKIIKRELTFHRRFRRLGLRKFFNRFPLEYERFWTYLCPAEHFKIWLQPIK